MIGRSITMLIIPQNCQEQVENFNFASDRLVMTRPRDDDAIWMLTNVGSIDTPKNNYKTCKNSDKKVIRSSFITNLRSEDHNSNSVKCWCSQCSKKRLCNNLKKDLLFISSD